MGNQDTEQMTKIYWFVNNQGCINDWWFFYKQHDMMINSTQYALKHQKPVQWISMS